MSFVRENTRVVRALRELSDLFPLRSPEASTASTDDETISQRLSFGDTEIQAVDNAAGKRSTHYTPNYSFICGSTFAAIVLISLAAAVCLHWLGW